MHTKADIYLLCGLWDDEAKDKSIDSSLQHRRVTYAVQVQ